MIRNSAAALALAFIASTALPAQAGNIVEE